jgi:hypothetical protein
VGDTATTLVVVIDPQLPRRQRVMAAACIPDGDAKALANVLVTAVSDYGAPRQLWLDAQAAHRAQTLRQGYARLGIDPVVARPSQPASVSFAERELARVAREVLAAKPGVRSLTALNRQLQRSLRSGRVPTGRNPRSHHQRR